MLKYVVMVASLSSVNSYTHFVGQNMDIFTKYCFGRCGNIKTNGYVAIPNDEARGTQPFHTKQPLGYVS